METPPSYRNLQTESPTLIDKVDEVLNRFDAEFIERKLREHREWQEREMLRQAEQETRQESVHFYRNTK
jgi:hypothetical protein